MRSQRLTIIPFFLISLSLHLVLFFTWSNSLEIRAETLTDTGKFLALAGKTGSHQERKADKTCTGQQVEQAHITHAKGPAKNQEDRTKIVFPEG